MAGEIERLERKKRNLGLDLKIARKQMEISYDKSEGFIYTQAKMEVAMLESKINALDELIREYVIGDSNY